MSSEAVNFLSVYLIPLQSSLITFGPQDEKKRGEDVYLLYACGYAKSARQFGFADHLRIEIFVQYFY